jgi:hypothetical protein
MSKVLCKINILENDRNRRASIPNEVRKAGPRQNEYQVQTVPIQRHFRVREFVGYLTGVLGEGTHGSGNPACD